MKLPSIFKNIIPDNINNNRKTFMANDNQTFNANNELSFPCHVKILFKNGKELNTFLKGKTSHYVISNDNSIININTIDKIIKIN